MRLRIQTCQPLPELKVWFIPDDKDAPVTIYDLKEALCQRIPPVNESRLLGHDLGLFLDDFELLDDSPFSAVRDGDLICIKAASSVQAMTVKVEGSSEVARAQKRKRSPTSANSILIPGRSVRTPTVVPKHKEQITSHDSDSDSSDSSSSTTSSSSTSSSSSSSSSSTTSSSSSSSPPVPQTSKVPQTSPKVPAKLPHITLGVLNVTPKLPNASVGESSKVQHTPPGHGSSETHARNLRRRYKKQAEREEVQRPKTLSEPPPPPPTSQQQRPMSLQPYPISQSPSLPEQPSSSPAPPLPAPPKGSSASNLVPLGRKKIMPTRRDRVGPANDVASALNNAFGSNATTGELNHGIEVDTDNMDVDDEPKPQLMMLSLKNKNKKKGFKQSMAAPIPKKIVFGDAEDVRQAVVDVIPSQQEYVRLTPPSEIQGRGELPPNMFVTSVDVERGLWDVVKEHRKPKNSKKKKNKEATWADLWFEEPQVQGKVSKLVFAGPRQEVTDNWKEEEVVEEAVVSRSTAFDWDLAEKVWGTSFEVKTPDQLAVGGLVGWKELGLNPQTFSPENLLFVAKITQIEGTQYTIRQLLRPGAGSSGFGVVGKEEVGEEEADEVHEWEKIISGPGWRVMQLDV